MFPPLFQTLNASAAVTALLGSGKSMRVYAAGKAPQNAQKPYLTWQTINGAPENYLGDAPDGDSFSLQLDVYASKREDAIAITKEVRDVVEQVAHITAWLGEGNEVDTELYRVSFQLDWFTDR